MKILRRGRLESPVVQIRANRERISRRDKNNEPIQIDKARGIPTVFADLGSDCRIETVESPTDCTRTKLAVYDRGSLRLVNQFEANERLLIPKEREHGIFKCLRLPKGAAIYESVHLLFHRTRKLLCTAVDLDPGMANLVSAFVMSTWFPEKLPVAPYLALIGMPRSGKTTMLRVLEKLCRHSIAVLDCV